MKKIGITISVIVITTIAIFLLTRLQNDVAGEIQLTVINEMDAVVIDETLSFTESDDLVSLLQEHYTVICANESYKPTTNCETYFVNGRIILGIESVNTDWRHSYMGIYVNGEYSNVGVDGIPLKDGDTITFEKMTIGDDN